MGESATLPDSLLKSTAIVRSFEPNKIINSSPNYSLIFDESGIMFVGQEDKISIFNGASWSQIHVKGEILLSRSSLNTVFFAGQNTFGYLLPDSTLNFRVTNLNDLLPEKTKNFGKIHKLLCADKSAFFQLDSFLLSYSSNEIKILEENFQNGKIFKCRDKIVCLKPGNVIDVFQNSTLEKNLVFPGPGIKMILEHDSGYLIINQENKVFLTNASFSIISEWSGRMNFDFKHGISLNSEEYLFLSTNNSLLICSDNGEIKSGFYTSTDIPKADIIEMVQEPSGNIWILQDKFISRIEYPSSLGIISGIPADYGYIRDTKVFENKIYLATTLGLFVLNQEGKEPVRTSISDFCYRLIPSFHGLFAFTSSSVSLLENNHVIPILTGKILDQSWNPVNHTLFVSESDKITALKIETGKAVNGKIITPLINPVKIVSVDTSLWISDGESLYRYDESKLTDQPAVKINLPDNLQISDLFNWQNKLYILCPDKIYSFSEGDVKYERSLTNDLCRGEILSLFEDALGNLWFLSRNKDKNSVLWFGNSLEKSFTKIVLPSYISLSNPSVDYIGKNKIILSAGSQLYLLDLNLYKSFTRKFETIINKIEAGDNQIFSGSSYNFFRVPLRSRLNNIPYHDNNIRIELSSTNYIDNKVKYQYYIEGRDQIWSEWSSNPYIYFGKLKEGIYNIRIRSKDYRGDTSEVTSLLFQIDPPFYRSWWAYVFYILSGGILLFIAYKTYLLNLHKALENGNVNNQKKDAIRIIETDPRAGVKNFDFYSNIDEDKVKDKTRWDKYEMVTVLFSDIQGFTKIAESMNPELLIDELDRFFFHFDSVVEKYNIEKIKTIGDAYMAAGGIPRKSIANPVEVVLAALEMQNYMKQLRKTKIDIWDLRIGIHSGPVIAGIIGHKKRSFDIWGDTVNTASRMESTGEAGKVNISSETYKFVKDFFLCEYRGKLPVKYKGNIDMYFVKGLRPELSINLVGLPNRKFFLKLQFLRLTDLEEFVFSKLEAELDKNLFFHSLEYTKHLYEYSSLLAKAEELDAEESLLLQTSTLLLNVGYTSGYENQENRSAEFARQQLPAYNYSEKQITIITNLILSTKWPPEPRNKLEMLMQDVKMEYVARADYIRLYKLLFLEQNHFLKSVDVLEFKRQQTELIKKVSFYSDSARRLREVQTEEQISRIREDEWK